MTSTDDKPPIRSQPAAVQRRSRVRMMLSAWLAAAAVIAYLCRNSITVAEKTIREDIGISEEAMGLILGPAFFWSYALAQIPGGLLGQRYGSRRCLPLFSLVSSAATALLGMAHTTWALMAGRLGGGVAQAGLFPCSAASISKWHPRAERALASGVLGASMSIGGAVGAALTGELLGWFSWRWVFALYAVPGIIWSIGFFVWFRDTPAEHPQVNDAELDLILQGQDAAAAKPDIKPRSTPWLKLAASPAMWLICSQQFFRAAGYAFFASWFATYLQETRGVSTAKSGWLLTIPLLASVAASLVGGGVSDWIYRSTGRLATARSALASGALLACAALVFSSWFVSDAILATVVIGAGAFCAALAGPCAYAATMDLGGRNVAMVFSTMNMVGNFGAGLLPLAVPHFRRWVQETPQLLHLAQGNSWNAVLVLFAVMYLLGAASWILLRVRDNALDSP